ncbi:MAG: ABC transporter permease [Chitinophagales bacterium]|nr:ABC transporter permease [Chitinophagales bacterium]OJV24255.1 MAG: ABC transporter [Bacteroidetes bacterium 37-13]HRN93520.1 ABC transporter permease [Chitinophagales bacterium]HRP39250.1 ABC transporter permease [Chitinophagales bacterium]
MISRVNFKIAKTHLLAKKKQTLVAMLGVTFGIGMYILMISFMSGFNEYLSDAMLSATPDVHLYNDIKTDYSHSILSDVYDTSKYLSVVHHPKPKDIQPNIKNPLAIVNSLKSDERVLAVSPQLTTQIFYNSGPVQINGSLQGVNIIEDAKLTSLRTKIKTGKIESLLTTSNGILMGHGLSKKLNVKVGDAVNLATPKGNSMRFRVVGTFQFGVGSIDNIRSYVNLASVQQLMGKNSQFITDINIKLKNNAQSAAMAKELKNRYHYVSEDWKTANASAMVGITVRDVMTIVVSFTLLVVAGFGIYNIMNMTIQNKLKDIAILKAQGFSAQDVRQIFLLQSITIGVLGALFGMVLGYIMSYGVYSLPFPSNEMISITRFPVTFHWYHYVFGLVFGIITTFFAGFFPSIKAGKIDPVEILRG